MDLIHKLTIGIVLVALGLSLLSYAGTILYVELATHFRLQYLLVALGGIGILLALQSWKFLPLAIVCALLNVVPILPYSLSKSQAHSSAGPITFKLLQSNALKSNQNYDGLLSEVKRINPDVLVLQELTEEWQTNTTILNQDFPHALLAPRPSGAGMAIFSKYPLLTKETLVLDSSTHVALKVEILVQQARIILLAMHPTTPITPWRFKNRNKQFVEAASIIRATNGPRLLVGDLNVTMWSPYFTRLVRESGLRDARRGVGLLPTWPTMLPSFLQLPIDHCLVSEEWSIQRVSTGITNGSDHKTLVVELALPALS